MAPKLRKKTEEIRRFMLQSVRLHSQDLAVQVVARFSISRQAANRHLTALVDEGLLKASGKTRARAYGLCTLQSDYFVVPLLGLKEDDVWQERVKPMLPADIPKNVYDICHYSFTEMLNNAIDHSEGTTATVIVWITAAGIHMGVDDNGVGIFNKLMGYFGYQDECQAMLELSKGKLTTDHHNHSGQGIFFTSKAVDDFLIVSGHMMYSYKNDGWLLDVPEQEKPGTRIVLEVSRLTDHTLKSLFDRYASEGDYEFTRTHISLELARYEGESLVSRSQAKRIMARLDGFTEAYLNFKGVDDIGQAFADEIFRVFQNEHPNFVIVPIDTNSRVDAMIRRARAG